MPLAGFAWLDQLSVMFQPSPEPQVIEVILEIPPGAPTMHAFARMGAVLDVINSGALSGAANHPASSRATVLGPPTHQVTARSQTLSWRVEVASVAPKFLRTVVDELRWSNREEGILGLSITGRPREDVDAPILRTYDVRNWLESATEYVDAWPTPPFSLLEEESSSDSYSLRIELADEISTEIFDELEVAIMRWLLAIREVAANDGTTVPPRPLERMPRFGVSRRVFRVFAPHFHHQRDACRDLLVNVLTAFSVRTAPVLTAKFIL